MEPVSSNPVERVWLYLRERFLSHRLLDDYQALLGAACPTQDYLAGLALVAVASA